MSITKLTNKIMRDLSVQHLPCPLFAFVVKLSNDSVFLIHVGSMHFLQFSERVAELQNDSVWPKPQSRAGAWCARLYLWVCSAVKTALQAQRRESAQTEVAQSLCVKANTQDTTETQRLCQETWRGLRSTNKVNRKRRRDFLKEKRWSCCGDEKRRTQKKGAGTWMKHLSHSTQWKPHSQTNTNTHTWTNTGMHRNVIAEQFDNGCVHGDEKTKFLPLLTDKRQRV